MSGPRAGGDGLYGRGLYGRYLRLIRLWFATLWRVHGSLSVILFMPATNGVSMAAATSLPEKKNVYIYFLVHEHLIKRNQDL